VISENASLGLMQNKNLLKERNGASLKPETQTPSFALDTLVVVIDNMTGEQSMLTAGLRPAPP
jgi:hypothetical protein